MLNSLINLFNQKKSNSTEIDVNNDIMTITGLLIEAAAIDGKIDDKEIFKIKESLINNFEVKKEESDFIIKKSLDKADESNSLHFFTSKINKEFDNSSKIKLIEILWEIVLADEKVHEFESNLIRRLSGLLYVSDVDCGNAKKRVLSKLERID